MFDVMHIPAPALGSIKYKYVVLFVCIISDFIVPYPLENLSRRGRLGVPSTTSYFSQSGCSVRRKSNTNRIQRQSGIT